MGMTTGVFHECLKKLHESTVFLREWNFFTKHDRGDIFVKSREIKASYGLF